MFSDTGAALGNVSAAQERVLEIVTIVKRISLSSGVKANRNKQRRYLRWEE